MHFLNVQGWLSIHGRTIFPVMGFCYINISFIPCMDGRQCSGPRCVSPAYRRCRSHGQRKTRSQPWPVSTPLCKWTLLSTPALKRTYMKDHDVELMSLALKESLLCDYE